MTLPERANYSLTESALSPFPAEPTHYHYTWCVNYAIAYAEKWRNRSVRIIPPFQYAFDKMDLKDPAREEIEKVMGLPLESKVERGNMLTTTFCRRKIIPDCNARMQFHGSVIVLPFILFLK